MAKTSSVPGISKWMGFKAARQGEVKRARVARSSVCHSGFQIQSLNGIPHILKYYPKFHRCFAAGGKVGGHSSTQAQRRTLVLSATDSSVRLPPNTSTARILSSRRFPHILRRESTIFTIQDVVLIFFVQCWTFCCMTPTSFRSLRWRLRRRPQEPVVSPSRLDNQASPWPVY